MGRRDVATAGCFDKLHQIWRHEVYLEMSPFHHTRKRLIMSTLTDSMSTGSSVLDAGCGIADLMSTLCERGVAAVGTDLALSALKFAKKRLPESNFVQSDTVYLPFRTGCYSIVVCSEVLEHVENHERAARELNRILLPGGIAVLTVPHGEQHWTFEDRIDGHLRRYTKKQFSHLMKRAGFSIEELRCWGFPLAVLFRKTISTPLYNRGFHESKGQMGKSRIFTVLLRVIVTLFRFDDLFHGTQLGLGLIAKLRKPISSQNYNHPQSWAR